MGYNEFKNKVCAYYNLYDNTKSKVPLFKSALDKINITILPELDNEHLFVTRDFINTADIHLNFVYDNIMCYYSEKEKSLIVGIICPNWNSGWNKISKDSIVSGEINTLFHFMSQYVYRSFQVNLIGAIALSTGRHTDFRGFLFTKSVGFTADERIKEFKTQITGKSSELDSSTIGYLKIINSLDPFVNKSIFYYTKSLALFESEYIEESLTAADNMIDTVFQSLKKRMNLPTMNRNEIYDIAFKVLKLYSSSDESNIDMLYRLRCRFTAHPSKSKWWDFHEIYEGDIIKIMISVRKILVLYLKYENENREVKTNPKLWSKWFSNNCEILYDAVWFHDIE